MEIEKEIKNEENEAKVIRSSEKITKKAKQAKECKSVSFHTYIYSKIISINFQ